jgi:hypothetical protein
MRLSARKQVAEPALEVQIFTIRSAQFLPGQFNPQRQMGLPCRPCPVKTKMHGREARGTSVDRLLRDIMNELSQIRSTNNHFTARSAVVAA